MNLKKLKGSVLKRLFLYKQVDKFYRNFQKEYPEFTKKNHWEAIKYIMRLNYAQYRHRDLKKVALPKSLKQINKQNVMLEDVTLKEKQEVTDFRYFLNKDNERLNVKEMYKQLKPYDVISFDIFDTALYRNVEFHNDVFAIMAMEMGHNDFINIRKKAEEFAGQKNEKNIGTREVVLDEIYDVLHDYYGIDPAWKKREIELEYDLNVPNHYILEVYNKLLADKKELIFTSDMYLPKDVIERMLAKNGYKNYRKIYLSNEYGKRKGGGTLQEELLKDFKNKKIAHIGDSMAGDVERTQESGIDAFYNPGSKLSFREPNMDNLAGSFYRAIIQNHLNNGLWDENLYFEHGYRVGGILTAGFCQFINNTAARFGIDKILFCARGCNVVWKAYNAFFKQYENEYIEISRYAIFNVTTERYLYDLANRTILRHADEARTTKTLGTILVDCGYDYLVQYLEEDDLEQFVFPSSLINYKKKLERFIFNHKHIIEQHNQESVEAAKRYFKAVIGDAKNILIADIGWSGTCITALQYFLKTHFPECNLQIKGVLLCTSRNKVVTNSMTAETISSYLYSPFENMDLMRFMMPAKVPAKEQDLLHMPLEFLFTSTAKSLVKYILKSDGAVDFERTSYAPANPDEITEMQKGILRFIKDFVTVSENYSRFSSIPAYTAFNPLRKSIEHESYCYEVYKNFTYDAFSAPFVKAVVNFASLFKARPTETALIDETAKAYKGKILFVMHELTYTGTPRSLLRMCKVAVALRYLPVVWSAKYGPFIEEYQKNNIMVEIVPEKELTKPETIQRVQAFDMAVCNTIVTDRYATLCSKYLPTVWYIREATNIPDFCRNNPERLYALKHSEALCCVSDYAAAAIHKFTDNEIMIIHNCVEDEKEMAVPYIPGSGEKIKFVQFGTMGYRKGYDVLVAAYKALPENYKKQTELYFAGGFINSGAPYCSYLFNKMKDEPNIHYLGVVAGEENKIRTLSSMDVVVVASRDESCSLVALEGAMLSKPLIVTENVGAKYIVGSENGKIAQTGDVSSLRDAMMFMIDNRNKLEEMGRASRENYEKMASMDSYTRDMQKLFAMCEMKESKLIKDRISLAIKYDSPQVKQQEEVVEKNKMKMAAGQGKDVVVSLTSYPGRIQVVQQCIGSLLKQTYMPQKILLWLSKEQFPNGEKDLPAELTGLQDEIFTIRWAEDDLKPHKKYFYAVPENPDVPLIIVDDNVIYDECLIERLMLSYRDHPECISCMRADLMLFNSKGNLRQYENWILGYKALLDTPTYQLLPTGAGGVLYPPGSIPEMAFDKNVILKTCLMTDDLWLKFMTMHNGYKVVVPRYFTEYTEIKGTQDVALYKSNIGKSNKDLSIEHILAYFDHNIESKEKILLKIRKDRFC